MAKVTQINEKRPIVEKLNWEDFPFAAFEDDIESFKNASKQDLDWNSPEFGEAVDIFSAEYPTTMVSTVKWINKAAGRVQINGWYECDIWSEKNKDCC